LGRHHPQRHAKGAELTDALRAGDALLEAQAMVEDFRIGTTACLGGSLSTFFW
jgi:hypothetical protein